MDVLGGSLEVIMRVAFSPTLSIVSHSEDLTVQSTLMVTFS